MGTNYVPLHANLLISVFVPTKTYFILGHLTTNGKQLAKSLGLQKNKHTPWMTHVMQELYRSEHIISPPFSFRFVFGDLLCLGSVLWIMVCPFVLFMLAIVLSVLDCFNVFMLQTYRFSLRYRDYDNFYLLFGCTVQWWHFFSLKIAILILPILVLFNGCRLNNFVFIYPYVMIILPC